MSRDLTLRRLPAGRRRGNYDGLCFFCNTPFQIVDVDIESKPVNLRNHGGSAHIVYRIEGGRANEAGQDDLIALTRAKRRSGKGEGRQCRN